MTTERQNARHSTGPRTPHGKAIARCNNTCHRFHAPVNADPPLATRSLPLSRVRERGSGHRSAQKHAFGVIRRHGGDPVGSAGEC